MNFKIHENYVGINTFNEETGTLMLITIGKEKALELANQILEAYGLNKRITNK